MISCLINAEDIISGFIFIKFCVAEKMMISSFHNVVSEKPLLHNDCTTCIDLSK